MSFTHDIEPKVRIIAFDFIWYYTQTIIFGINLWICINPFKHIKCAWNMFPMHIEFEPFKGPKALCYSQEFQLDVFIVSVNFPDHFCCISLAQFNLMAIILSALSRRTRVKMPLFKCCILCSSWVLSDFGCDCRQ